MSPLKRVADSSVEAACRSMSFGFSRDQCDFDFVQVDTVKSHVMKTHRVQCGVVVEACPVVCRSLLPLLSTQAKHSRHSNGLQHLAWTW